MRKRYVNILKTRSYIKTFFFILFITGINHIIIFGKTAANRNDCTENCEHIYVHLDKKIYVAGDYIRYKVYVLNDMNLLQSPESKVLYFVLTERKSGEQFPWRINLSNSTLYGSYKLPGDMNPGVYQLAVFTNLVRESNPAKVFYRELIVLNLGKETPDTIYVSPSDTIARNQTETTTGTMDQPPVRLALAKSAFAANEKVILEVSADNLQISDTANLSVSVINETPFDDTLQVDNIVQQLSRYRETNETYCSDGLEDKSYLLSGHILNKSDGSPVRNTGIFLAVIDSLSPKIKYSASDDYGCFHFYLSQFYDNREIIVQSANGVPDSEITWSLDKKTVPYSGSPGSQVLLSGEQINCLDQAKDIKLIEAVYTEDVTMQKTIETMPEISYFACPDITIIPDDYAEMANFREITLNIIPQLRLRTRKEEYYLEVYNETRGGLGENNLLLLNGVPFKDINYIATLGTRDIRKIEVINSGSFIAGDLKYNAVVSIYTHDVALPEPYLKNYAMVFYNTVAGTDEKAEGIRFGVPERSWSHFPDFRSNLYWNPDLKVPGKNTMAVEFTTSLLQGKFRAEVQGITSSGIPVVAYISFSVTGEESSMP